VAKYALILFQATSQYDGKSGALLHLGSDRTACGNRLAIRVVFGFPRKSGKE